MRSMCQPADKSNKINGGALPIKTPRPAPVELVRRNSAAAFYQFKNLCRNAALSRVRPRGRSKNLRTARGDAETVYNVHSRRLFDFPNRWHKTCCV